jgi:hypothetical protein
MAEVNICDNILRQAFQEYMEEKLDSNIYRDESFSTSKSFEKKMSKMIKSEHNVYHKMTLTKARKALCVAIAIIILLLSSLSVGAVRDFIANFYIQHFDTHNTLTAMLDDNENYPTKIEKVYKLSSIPKGYELSYEDITDNDVSYLYSNSEGKNMLFTQDIKSIFDIDIDNEYSNATAEVYQGQLYFVNVFDSDYAEGARVTIIWDNGSYIFCLSAELPKETMLDLCSSLKIEE